MTITNLGKDRPNNVSSFTTNVITPQNRSLVLIAIGNRLDSAPSNVPTVSGLGMTWTEIATVVHTTGGGANQGVRVTFYIGLVTGNLSGAITVDFASQVQLDSSYSIEQIVGADVRNNGLQAIIQNVSGTTTSTNNQSLSLAAFKNVRNIAYAVFYNGGAGSVGGSGFTVLAVPPNAMLLSEYAVNNTGPSYSYTGPNASAGLAVEIGIAKKAGVLLGFL